MLPVKHPEALKWFWKRPLKWTIDGWKPPIFKLGASSCTEDNAEPPDAVPLGLPVATHELGKPTFWPTEYQHIINYSEWFYELQRCVDNGCFPLWIYIYIYYINIYIYIILYWKTLIIWVLLVLQPNPYHMMDANEKVTAKKGDMNLNMIYELARSLRKSTAWGVHPSIHAF